mgnify:CR=1 FL=1
MTTPRDLRIRPRNIAFFRDGGAARWWLNDDPVATAFYNALSVTFPQGERFFMDSVRRFRGEATGELAEQITAFTRQEAMHTREHLAFNRLAADHGYDVAAMEARTHARLQFARSRTPLLQLAATVALEHFTAILAHALLADPRHLEGAEPRVANLWRWHAIEEVEHKSVAFDAFRLAARRLPAIRRWHIRFWAMTVATILLFRVVAGNMGDFLRQDGIGRGRALGGSLRLLWIRPGLLRRILLPYLSWFRPGFHPWDHDDRALLRQAERELGSTYPLESAA